MRRMYAGVGGGEVISCLKTSLRSLMEVYGLWGLGRARDTHLFVYTHNLVRQSCYSSTYLSTHPKSRKDSCLVALCLGQKAVYESPTPS
jgi:hypothetical protein